MTTKTNTTIIAVNLDLNKRMQDFKMALEKYGKIIGLSSKIVDENKEFVATQSQIQKLCEFMIVDFNEGLHDNDVWSLIDVVIEMYGEYFENPINEDYDVRHIVWQTAKEFITERTYSCYAINERDHFPWFENFGNWNMKKAFRVLSKNGLKSGPIAFSFPSENGVHKVTVEGNVYPNSTNIALNIVSIEISE